MFSLQQQSPPGAQLALGPPLCSNLPPGYFLWSQPRAASVPQASVMAPTGIAYLFCFFSMTCRWASADHNEEDVFAVVPLPPKPRRLPAVPPKAASPSLPPLPARSHPDQQIKARTVSCKKPSPVGILAPGSLTAALPGVFASWSGTKPRAASSPGSLSCQLAGV